MVFFSILPPPPISTLFPYTTLFRSQEHPRGDRIEPGEWQRRIALQQGVLGVPRIEINRHCCADAIVIERALGVVPHLADVDARSLDHPIAQRELVLDMGNIPDFGKLAGETVTLGT